MDIRKTLEELETLLEEERKAILTLDSERVAAFAGEKERALARLRDAPESLKPMRENVVRIVKMARHNCLLLANARDAIHAAVKSMSPLMVDASPSRSLVKPPARGVRLSVMR